MKHLFTRMLAALISLLAVCSIMTPVAFCADDSLVRSMDPSNEYEKYSDGWDEISELDIEVGKKTPRSEFEIVTGSYTVSHYSSKKELVWSATLTATFEYNGDKASCISVSITPKTYKSGWSVEKSWTEKSNNVGSGHAYFTKNIVGADVESGHAFLRITCDPKGNLRKG